MAKKYLDDNGLLYLWGKIKALFVQKETGKGLSTNDYTTAEKNKLAGIASGAEVNVQSDWNATSGDAQILNKPTKLSDFTNDSGFITSASVPSATTTTPKMDGTASVGSETKYAKGDHVHPSDTSRVPTTTKVNGHALSGDVTVTASDIGVESGAQANVLEGVKLNGTELTITSKKVDIPVYRGAGTGEAGAQGIVPAPAQLTNANDIRYLSNKGEWRKLPIISAVGNVLTYPPITAMTDPIVKKFAPLDDNDKIDAQYLPSFVDDVVEAYPVSGATELSAGWLSETSGGSALTPTSGVIYVLMADTTNYATNTQFRWATNTYVKLNDGGVTAITNGEIDTIVAS